MILITMVLVLFIERIAATTQLWQFDFYYQQLKSLLIANDVSYDSASDSASDLDSEVANDTASDGANGAVIEAKSPKPTLVHFAWLLLPVAIIALIEHSIEWSLLALALDVMVLLVCIGCLDKRKIYKSFLNAAARKDSEACALYAAKLQGDSSLSVGTKTDDENMPRQLGLTLVWYNYQYYCAVLFWFVLFGLAGAFGYCLVRQVVSDEDGRLNHQLAGLKLPQLLHVLDWLPARVCSAGYLLIGDFTRSAGIWLSYLLDFSSPAQSLVTGIANAAESPSVGDTAKHAANDSQGGEQPQSQSPSDNMGEPEQMLKLAKRNILFFLAMVAVLTLYGAIA